MSGSSGHPARVLFDTNFVPGLLQTIVLEEHARDSEITEGPDEVGRFFESAGCPSVAQLITRLEQKRSKGIALTCIGSGSIDLNRIVDDPESCNVETAFSSEKGFQELYFGIKRLSINPVEWLVYLARGFDRVPVELRPTFDSVVQDLVAFDAAIDSSKARTVSEESLEQRPFSELLDEISPTDTTKQ